ncbi:MAG: aminopeptidase, partial [Bacteroidota bacterium]
MNHNPATDIHSYARPTEAVVQHIDLDLAVDFAEKALSGKATLIIRNISGGEKLWLDSKGLRIERITLGTDDKPTTFDRGTADAIMGESICVKIENT